MFCQELLLITQRPCFICVSALDIKQHEIRVKKTVVFLLTDLLDECSITTVTT